MSKSIASTSSLIFYGIGNLSPAIKSNFLGAPIFYYYNNVLGLDALLVSLALAIALIVDGITDPLIGYFSDYTKSRLGRRHPYIFASILPGALFYFLLITWQFASSQIGARFRDSRHQCCDRIRVLAALFECLHGHVKSLCPCLN